MSLSRIMRKEMAKSGGTARVVKVPKSMRPTAASLKELGREISSQIDANDAMRHRSMVNAQ